MDKYSYLSNGHAEAIEDLYKKYQENPESLDSGWRKFFEGFEFSKLNYSQPGVAQPQASAEIPENLKKEFTVLDLISRYRVSGHLYTETNPVRERRKYTPTLDDIELLGLGEADMDVVFQAGNEIGLGPATLRDIIAHLKRTYCRNIGVEYMHIRNPKMRKWVQQRMELQANKPELSLDDKKHILKKLDEAEYFENFLHTKFVGQKRFSLEGLETLIPALDFVIEKGAEFGIKEFVLGMAHRGRLNVLANIMGKSYSDIFTEFEGKRYEEALFAGDVKYHLGYSCDIETRHGHKVHLSLTPNPSHLETVDPVVEGITRAKLDRDYAGDYNKIAPILIHGDAAIAGQGVVYEVVQMSLLRAYKIGGTIHIVANNQIGFTTNEADARSSTYCTDVAKVVMSPVFHVNGDDVEAIAFVVQLAMEFRQQFHRDVFIDILGYRKYGHNEGDEPRFTQPVLYKEIAKHPNPRDIYYNKLLEKGDIDPAMAKEMGLNLKNLLQQRLDEAKQANNAKLSSFLEGKWNHIRKGNEADFDHSPETGVNKAELLRLADIITTIPGDKKFFTKIAKLFKDRQNMLQGDGNLDWAMGELLAYASLLNEKHMVRFSGQDVERGTFSHRHAVITLEDSEEKYVPLCQLGNNQGEFHIYNSLLSEYAVLGFEYGYAMANAEALTIWEAQFGDFFNGAQIIVDQYISSAEDKWRRMNGLVMLLPHGYEGQGAEHSSGRIERFLILCANNNIQVANCTSPAQMFHLLRRQLKRPIRKPLIVFTPKSLLRHPKCVSKISDFTEGSKFREVIDDNTAKAESITKVALCSGKIYYELLAQKEADNNQEIAIVRLEQIYPFPKKQLLELVEKYKNAEWTWVQEEPENMGAWTFLLRKFTEVKLNVISRPESASPATGNAKKSAEEQRAIIDALFTKVQETVAVK